MKSDKTDASGADSDPTPPAPPEQTGDKPMSYGVLLKDVEGVGIAGRVVASPTKVGLQRLIDADSARATTDDEVEMARPYITTLEA